jgi:predicted O-methyltransferase YrrM
MTGLLPMRDDAGEGAATGATAKSWDDRLAVIAYGSISWPFLLYSLWGGTRADKRRLLARVGLTEHALPNLGSWKADTGFLHRIVDAVEELRPHNVVELGAGASSLVCARALQLHGGGTLHSFDQHAGFVAATREWLQGEGVEARLNHAPLEPAPQGDANRFSGSWYALSDLPEVIDLLIIDGPPWTVHPLVRGGAEVLFDRLSPGAMVLLDDASRPGERVIARRWADAWPGMQFERLGGSTKGTLVGRKLPTAEVVAFPRPRPHKPARSWRRVASAAALLALGWFANDVTGELSRPAQAASFIEEADASAEASLMRQQMDSQVESVMLDRAEISRVTGLALPALPADWRVVDVQLFPSDMGTALTVSLQTPAGDALALFATRAETPAEALPLLERREGRSLAYWEQGPMAYALSGEIAPAQVLALAAKLAGSQSGE